LALALKIIETRFITLIGAAVPFITVRRPPATWRQLRGETADVAAC
jgi:hypothetical protein